MSSTSKALKEIKQSSLNPSRFLLRLLLVSVLYSQCFVNSYPTTAVTSYDGVTQDGRPSFYRLDGTTGIKAQIYASSKDFSSYFVKMWVRSTKSLSNLGQVQETFFDVNSKLACSIYPTSQILCNSTDDKPGIQIDIQDISYYQWIHIALSGSTKQNTTYLKIDYADQNYKLTSRNFMKVTMSSGYQSGYLGINSKSKYGFSGDIREFLISQIYVPSGSVDAIRNQIMFFDTSYLAYYRLNAGSLNEAQSNATATYISSNSTSPLVVWENLPNDICYPYVDYAEIPYLSIVNNTKKAVLSSNKLDSRFDAKQYSYQYSASMWIKQYPGSTTTTSPYDGNSLYYIFKLGGVFALWYPDPSHIAAYFYSANNYQDNYTSPISFPMYQWANFQLIMDQTKGYEVRIYNVNRQLITKQAVSVYMAQQIPTSIYNINNFYGYIKSLVIYQSNMTFPIVMPGAYTDTVTNKLVILYYQFDKANFNNNSLQALNNDISQGRADPFVFTNVPQFDQVIWEDSLNYSTPLTMGTLLQNVSLFDGIACNDQNYTLYHGSNTSYIKYPSNQFQQNTTELTVELWFKNNISLTNKSYLFTIAATPSNKEYFSIYQDNDNKIKCIPFPYSVDNSSLKNITIADTDNTYTSWQHVACKFKSQAEIALQYDNIDGGQFFYSIDIIGQNYSIPGGNYTIIIGNSPSLAFGSANTFFKEVRVWTKMISTQQIIQYLYQKVDQNFEPKLVNYFQMAMGDTYVYDYNGTQATRSGILTQIESTQTMCPFYSYQNQFTKNGCSKSPNVNYKIHFFAEPLNTSPFIQYHLTPQFSELVNDKVQSYFNYNWIVQDSQVQSNSVMSQQNNKDLYLTKNSLVDNQAYVVSLETSNPKSTFDDQLLTTITPVGCRYIGDVSTKRQINEIILTQQQGSEDINMWFTVYNVQNVDCSTSTKFNTIKTALDLYLYPASYTPSAVVQNFISSNNTFHIAIPADYQYMIPYEKYLNLVATVYWQDQGGNTVSLNIAYRIMFAYTINPVVSAKFTNILVGQDLLIYGGNSSVINLAATQQDKAGLGYSWQCADIYTDECSNYYNLKFLKIVYSDFLASNGGYDQAYVFQLAAWRANNYDSYANSTAQMTIYWRNVQIPDFDIVVNGDTVLASSDNTFYINLYNYVSDDSDLFISWFFYPSVTNQDSNLQFSHDNTVIQVYEGGFNFSTNYTLQVSVLNTLYPSESVMTHIMNFTIGMPPYNGTVTATPKNGTFLSTLFYFSIASWQSNYTPVKFRVYGIKDGVTDPILLTSTWQTQGKTFNSTLPSLISVIFEITDSKLETVMVPTSLVVTINAGTDFSSVISGISKTASVTTKYQDYGYVVQELSGTSLSTAQIQQYQALIINSIVSDLSNITYYNTSNATLTLITAANAIIPMLLSNSSNINSTIAQSSYQALLQISVSPVLFAQALSDEDFQNDYADSLSLLLAYASQSLSSGSRRMLQSQTMNSLTQQLLIQKQNYTDTLCSILTTYQTKKSIKTTTYETMIEKILLNSTALSRSYQNSDGLYQMIVPLTEIIQKTVSYYNTNLTDICIQASFYSMNLFKGLNFANQSQNVNQYMQVETMDNLGNHVVDYGDINNLKYPFDPTFTYNFGDSSLNFSSNQTVCEYINTTLTPLTTANAWTTGTCQTNYMKDSNTIQCMCSSIGPYFYAVINDYNRIHALEINQTINQTSPNNPIGTVTEIKFSLEVLALIIAIGLINICMPFIAIMNDKRDYNSLKNDIYDVNDEFLKKLAMKKQMPLERLLYQKKLIAQFKSINNIKCCSIFSLFARQLHPLLSIVYKFDVEIKRLVRYMILLYQICIIAIISTAVFGINYRESEQKGDRTNMDNDDLTYALALGAILSLLTLPLPNALLGCIRTKLVLEGDIEKKKQAKETMKTIINNETVINHDVSTTQIKNQADLKKNKHDASPEDQEGNPQTQQRLHSNEEEINARAKQKKQIEHGELFDFSSIEDPVTAIDNCIPLKIMLIMMSQALCIGTIVYVAITSSHVPRAQSLCIVICWFEAVFGGWLVINLLRIIFIVLFSPPVVKNQNANEGIVTGTARVFDCLIVPDEAKDLLTDIFIVYNIQQDGGEMSKNDPQSKYDEGDQLKQDEEKQDDSERNQQKYHPEIQMEKKGIIPKTPAYKVTDDDASQNGSKHARQQAKKAHRLNRLKDDSQIKGIKHHMQDQFTQDYCVVKIDYNPKIKGVQRNGDEEYCRRMMEYQILVDHPQCKVIFFRENVDMFGFENLEDADLFCSKVQAIQQQDKRFPDMEIQRLVSAYKLAQQPTFALYDSKKELGKQFTGYVSRNEIGIGGQTEIRDMLLEGFQRVAEQNEELRARVRILQEENEDLAEKNEDLTRINFDREGSDLLRQGDDMLKKIASDQLKRKNRDLEKKIAELQNMPWYKTLYPCFFRE